MERIQDDKDFGLSMDVRQEFQKFSSDRFVDTIILLTQTSEYNDQEIVMVHRTCKQLFITSNLFLKIITFL